jgi:hypothetical protein
MKDLCGIWHNALNDITIYVESIKMGEYRGSIPSFYEIFQVNGFKCTTMHCLLGDCKIKIIGNNKTAFLWGGRLNAILFTSTLPKRKAILVISKMWSSQRSPSIASILFPNELTGWIDEICFIMKYCSPLIKKRLEKEMNINLDSCVNIPFTKGMELLTSYNKIIPKQINSNMVQWTSKTLEWVDENGNVGWRSWKNVSLHQRYVDREVINGKMTLLT